MRACYFCQKPMYLEPHITNPPLARCYICYNCQPGSHVVHQQFSDHLFINFRFKMKEFTYEVQWFFHPNRTFSSIRKLFFAIDDNNFMSNPIATFGFPLDWTPTTAPNKLKTILPFL